MTLSRNMEFNILELCFHIFEVLYMYVNFLVRYFPDPSIHGAYAAKKLA